MIHRLAVALALVLAATAARAQVPAPWSSTDRQTLARLCAATAREAPSPLAIAIAGAARAEHEVFGGHVIDRDGRMIRFGAVESDAYRGPQDGRVVPWRQVMRYWETLGADREGPLQVRRHPGLAEEATRPGAGETLPLAELLAAAGRASLPPAQRDALIQSLMRAAASDIPWSAAFVSHVLITAGAPRTRFTPSIAHVDYVAEAGRRSTAEMTGGTTDLLYRACDPFTTAARPGDLLCLHRHAPAEVAGLDLRAGLFPALMAPLAGGARPVWNLHCDVVVARDGRRRAVTLIGGNVLQSVTRRDIATTRAGALPRYRQPPRCPAEASIGPLCHPEAAAWFVLMQMAAGTAENE